MSASYVIALLMAFAGTDGTSAAPAESPAAAPVQDPAAAPAKANKMICRSVEVLGSRLQKNKVCMTSSEWAEQRRVDRMNIDKAQRFRTTQGN